jgi:hypothetical protein
MTGTLGRSALIVGVRAQLVVGCAQTNQDTAAGRSDIAGKNTPSAWRPTTATYYATQSAFSASRMNRVVRNSFW